MTEEVNGVTLELPEVGHVGFPTAMSGDATDPEFYLRKSVVRPSARPPIPRLPVRLSFAPRPPVRLSTCPPVRLPSARPATVRPSAPRPPPVRPVHVIQKLPTALFWSSVFYLFYATSDRHVCNSWCQQEPQWHHGK